MSAATKRPRVLLVRVPEIEIREGDRDLRTSAAAGLSVPLGIATLASVIKTHDRADVDLLDLYVDYFDLLSVTAGIALNDMIARLAAAIVERASLSGSDIVGFSALFAFQHPLVKRLAAEVRIALPDVRLYLGGYVTVAPDYVMREIPELDVIFIGEADKTLCQVLEAEIEGTALDGIPGIAFRDAGTVRCNKHLNVPQNLDEVGSPAFGLLPLEKYKTILGRAEFPILTSRSCPFSCNFCSSRLYSGRKMRKRSVVKLLDEVERNVREFGMEFLWVRDDNFIADKNHVKAFLSGIIERKLPLRWCDSSGFHVNSLDEELLDLCKASGCTEAIFAVESGSPRVLKEIMNKDVDLDHALRMADYCHTIALPLQVYFVVGSPGETEAEIQQTVDLALRMKVDHCTFSIATPFPGTKYYELAVERGYLIHSEDNILSMQYMTANMDTEHLSAQRVKDLQYDANIRVNFLESILLSGDRQGLEAALERFARVFRQYPFHAVSRVIQGYLHSRLGQQAEADAVFRSVGKMLQDENIANAYGKYFHWDTPATTAYRQWRGAGQA